MTSSSSSDTGNDNVDTRPSFMKNRKDPGAFLLPLIIERHHVGYGLVDSGTAISSLPVHIVRKLGIDAKIKLRHEMVERDGIYFGSIGQIKDLPVKIGKLEFSVNFTIMRGVGDSDVVTPIILGRIFLAQAQAEIDFRNARLILNSRFDSEIYGLEDAELEWRHRGMVRPLCDEVTYESKFSKPQSRGDDNYEPEEDPVEEGEKEESEPEVDSKPKLPISNLEPQEAPLAEDEERTGTAPLSDPPRLMLVRKPKRRVQGKGPRPKVRRIQIPEHTQSPEVPDHTPSPMV